MSLNDLETKAKAAISGAEAQGTGLVAKVLAWLKLHSLQIIGALALLLTLVALVKCHG